MKETERGRHRYVSNVKVGSGVIQVWIIEYRGGGVFPFLKIAGHNWSGNRISVVCVYKLTFGN